MKIYELILQTLFSLKDYFIRHINEVALATISYHNWSFEITNNVQVNLILKVLTMNTVLLTICICWEL